MSWTLSYSGTTQSLAAWGITGLSRNLRSQAVSTVTFRIPGNAFAALPFAQRGTIVIHRDAAVWFRGIVIQQAAAASGSTEQIQVTAADAWWHLENLVYAQRFNEFAGWVGEPGGEASYTEKLITHVTLNLGLGTGVIGTRAQMADALDYAADNGAPFQFVEGELPDMKVPLREEKDITCAEVIRRQMAYMDAVTWFDYSTSPPTLKVKRRSDCSVVSRAAAGLQSVSLRPRYDLQVPFVHLKFEKNYNDTGGSFMQLVEQKYPDPLPDDKFGGLLATIVLSPLNATTLVQAVECDVLDAESLDFWKLVKPELNNPDQYRDLAIFGNASAVDENGDAVALPRFVVAGGIADWMDVDAVLTEVSVDIAYSIMQELDTGVFVPIGKSRTQTIKTRVLATDAVTGVYRNRTVQSFGEDPTEFAGLAQTIYGDLNTLSWDGSIGLVEDEVGSTISVGNVVNLTGGPAGWASMNALVQSVTEDVDAGSTSVELGVNSHLSAGQLVELLRVNRTRSVLNVTQNRATGNNAESVLPSNFSQVNTTEAPKFYSETGAHSRDVAEGLPQVKLETGTAINSPKIYLQRLTVTGAVDEGAGRILIEQDRTGGRTLRVYEAKVCLPNGDEKYCRVLASQPYDNPELSGETPIGSDEVTP
jgi:hypothetical protein